MIYTKEAHADDIWPVGYGINSTKTLEERVTNCDALCNKYLGLFELVDAVFIDNMNDDFTETTGAWPEGYIFTDCEGKALWKSNFDIKGVYSLEKVYNFAVEQGFGIQLPDYSYGCSSFYCRCPHNNGGVGRKVDTKRANKQIVEPMQTVNVDPEANQSSEQDNNNMPVQKQNEQPVRTKKVDPEANQSQMQENDNVAVQKHQDQPKVRQSYTNEQDEKLYKMIAQSSGKSSYYD